MLVIGQIKLFDTFDLLVWTLNFVVGMCLKGLNSSNFKTGYSW